MDSDSPAAPGKRTPLINSGRMSAAPSTPVGAEMEESFCELNNLPSSSTLGARFDEASHDWGGDWELASNCTAGETGPGGQHNLVAPGVVGAEYRQMKGALPNGSPRGASTPQRDPYHGRCIDPKCAPT